MGKNTWKALALSGITAAVAFGVSLSLVKQGGQEAPDTFEIVTVDSSAGPEPSVVVSVSPSQLPLPAPPRATRSHVPPASPWVSPEISAAGGRGGGAPPPITPSAKPNPTKKG